MEVDVDVDPSLGQFVDEVIETVERFRRQGPSILCVPYPSWPPCRIHVMAPDTVDPGGRQANGDLPSVLVRREVRPERQVDAPDAHALGIPVEVAVTDDDVFRIDGDGLVLRDPDCVAGVDLRGDDKRYELLGLGRVQSQKAEDRQRGGQDAGPHSARSPHWSRNGWARLSGPAAAGCGSGPRQDRKIQIENGVEEMMIRHRPISDKITSLRSISPEGLYQ